MRCVHLRTGWNAGLTGCLRQSQNAIFIGVPNEDQEVPWNVSDLSLRLCRRQVLIRDRRSQD